MLIKSFLHFCKRCPRLGLTSPMNRPVILKKRVSLIRIICYCTIPAYNVKFEGERTPKSLEVPDPQTMTHGYLIKNATISAIDSATTLLTQTACRLMELEDMYSELLKELITLMEMHIKVLGSGFHEAKIWDDILQTRFQINEVKIQKQEIETLYFCAEKMTESAAEAAHTAGAEYAGIAASERLFSARTHVNHIRDTSQELESKLRKIEVKNIKETSKQAEKLKKQKEELASQAEATDETEQNEQNSENKNINVDEEETDIIYEFKNLGEDQNK